MCAVLLTSTSDSSLGCTVLVLGLLVPVIFESLNFDRMCTWVDSFFSFFDTVCFKIAIWSCVLHLADLPIGIGSRQIRVVSAKSIVMEGIFSPFVLASAI